MRLLAALLACALPAQVVKMTNGSAMDWTGWRRVTAAAPHEAGWQPSTGVRYRRVDATTVDLHCHVPAGQTVQIDVTAIPRVAMPRAQAPADPVAQFGEGTNLTVQSCEESGAGFLLIADELSVVWYPSQPGWCGARLNTGSATVVQVGYVPVIGDAATWMDPRPLTFVWWRWLTDVESAMADCFVEAR